MQLFAKRLIAAASLLVASQETSYTATTTYTNQFFFFLASGGLPGEGVNISFDGYSGTPLIPGSVLSDIAFFGDRFIVQYIPGLPFDYLNNYESDNPLKVRFPTGARAFGAFFSSWLAPGYPPSIPITARTDQGEVFTFNAFTSDAQSRSINTSYFGLIPDSPIYEISFSDGAIFNSAGYMVHMELIAQILAVVNNPPTLDIVSSPTNQLSIGVNGAAGQTIVLLTSTNLATWQPVVTNKLASDCWIYSTTQTNFSTPRFYRVGAR